MPQLDYSTLDDATSVRLVVRARAETFSHLYAGYSMLVSVLALNSVGDTGTAEEITRDVFGRVWRRARQYRADCDWHAGQKPGCGVWVPDLQHVGSFPHQQACHCNVI